MICKRHWGSWIYVLKSIGESLVLFYPKIIYLDDTFTIHEQSLIPDLLRFVKFTEHLQFLAMNPQNSRPLRMELGLLKSVETNGTRYRPRTWLTRVVRPSVS